MPSGQHADVAIAGAGIVGLAHALDAVRRGLSVIVVERDTRARGASVRNFGHGCFTVQAGEALEYAFAARERWLELARDAGLWVSTAGTAVIARHDDEVAVLEEFAAARGQEQVRWLDDPPVDALAAAHLPLDIRVDPRTAIPQIAAHLAEQGVVFHYATTTLGAEPGTLHTSRGPVHADTIIVATGHDLGRLFPALAEEHGLQQCALHMLRVASPGNRRIEPAILTGTSLLRYQGFAAAAPSLARVRERITAQQPELIEAGVNLMLTQRPDGDLTIGDTHAYGRDPAPFQDERLDELILSETAHLLGVDRLEVKERWRGVYAHAPDREFLVEAPADGVRAVAVTSGIGMTTALGLAPRVLDDVLRTPTEAR